MTDRAPDFFVPALGIRTPVWRFGAEHGVPLIMVHGFRGDHHGLQLIAEELAMRQPERPILVPDLPGFGEALAVPGRIHDLPLYGEWLQSFAESVSQQVRVTSLETRDVPSEVDIVGHSFGSLVVAQALAFGLSAHTITLINPISAPALSGPNAVMTKLAVGYYRTAKRLSPRAAHALLGNPVIVRFMSEFMAKTRDPRQRRWIHHQHAQYFSQFADAGTLLEAFQASVEHTVGEFAHAFTSPTLLIVGDRDDITPVTEQLRLRDTLDEATLRVIPGVGHLVHYEAAADAAGYLAQFLGQHVSPSDTKDHLA